ncbi:MAG: zf-HC2 domain-containing protein [Thermoanaerobaculia bacterium]
MNPPAERIVAGMSCGDVLDVLSDFLDGELDTAVREQVISHLRGCNWCEQFGGRFQHVIGRLRENFQDAAPLAADVTARLLAKTEEGR